MAESTAAVGEAIFGAGEAGAGAAAADVGAGAVAADVGAGAAAADVGAGAVAIDIAGADATASYLGPYSNAAEALNAGVSPEALGLPAGYTAGEAAAAAEAAASGASAAMPTAEQLTAQYAAQAGQGFGVGDLAKGIGYAKTGAQLIGGLGQVAGAAKMLGGGQTKPGVADPYAQYRGQNAAQLQNLLMNPQTVTSTPGYQFNLSQGLQGLQAQQAAQGRLVSGGALLQGQQFGQQLAQSSLSQQEQMLAQLSGATQAPAGAAQAQQGINFGQIGAGALGLQQLAGGAANVLNPLQTLYSQYNQSSPSVS